MIKPTIFLDIDGVLCVAPKERDEFGFLFNNYFVNNLKIIIEKTNAEIVLISSWRTNGLISIQTMWEMRDLPGEVVDVTSVLNTTRGEEIEEYIINNNITNYVIIDDSYIDLNHDNRIVKTSEQIDNDSINGLGLTKSATEKAIKILTT